MSKTDHLAKAKDYIAKGEDYYRRAADEIVAAMKADPTLTQQKVADALGKHQSWVARLMSARINDTPVKWGSGSNKREDVARKVLSDPEQTREVIASLSAKQLDAIASAASETLIERHRAERAEHNTEPTARELMGGERFDPSEFWADTPLISVSRAVDVLESRVQRAGGVILGALSQDEAYERLIRAERQISEIRAAVQEQIRDEVSA